MALQYKNIIILRVNLLKHINYFHKFPLLPSCDNKSQTLLLLSYRYTSCVTISHTITQHWSIIERGNQIYIGLEHDIFNFSVVVSSITHIFMITKQSESLSDHLKKTSSNAHRWCLTFEVNYLHIAPHLMLFSFHGIVH